MSDDPQRSSEPVARPLRVVVCSTRITLEGLGEACVVRDVAELIMAIDDGRRSVLVVDARSSPIELRFLAGLAADFPRSVDVIVQGEPALDRRFFHDYGVYSTRFEPASEGVLPDREATLRRSELEAAVRAKLIAAEDLAREA